MLPVRILCTFLFVIGLSVLPGCNDDDDEEPVVKNCRIKEMYFDPPFSYVYQFHYNNDGTLNSVTSTIYSINYKYENGRIKTIEQIYANGTVTLTYAYPSEKMLTWTTTTLTYRTYNLYHTGDKVDSLIVVDAPTGYPSIKHYSVPTYVGNNVETLNTGGNCCAYTVDDIEYDNGLNPASLLRKSVGAFNGQDILVYVFLGLKPEQLSENNPTKYQMSGYHNDLIEFEYTYATPGSYPLTISQYSDGDLIGATFNFVYENCP